MRETSFGKMKKYHINGLLQGEFEVMLFEKEGRPHTHETDEFAICVFGTGKIYTGSRDSPKAYDVGPGDMIEIKRNHTHWMKPDDGQSMSFVILYRALTIQKD